MMKYEEEHYLYENIKDKIYPWVKESLVDHKALNGKYISDKDTPIVSFAGDLMVIFVIERDKDTYEILKDNMLPPDTDMELLYHTACENLARNVKFVIGHTIFGLCAVKSLMMILSLWRRRKIWFYLFLQAIKSRLKR